ncbi:MAG TPA: hypothetical protein ENF16_06595 [Bacteroidetes bacterium]|nr:hypothetical protein [Bacteroidota bacterium]
MMTLQGSPACSRTRLEEARDNSRRSCLQDTWKIVFAGDPPGGGSPADIYRPVSEELVYL